MRMAVSLGALAAVTALATGCAEVRYPDPRAVADPAMVAVIDRQVENACNPALARALAAVRVPASAVRTVVYGFVWHEYSGEIDKYDAWVSLDGRPGHIVVLMDDDCTLEQTYVRGGARFPE